MTVSADTCDLAYPEKFFAASQFAQTASSEVTDKLEESTKMLLYALHQQACRGPNKTTRPWGLFNDPADICRWDAWTDLGTMLSRDAAEMYVATIEEDFPEWWLMLTGANKEKEREVKILVDTAVMLFAKNQGEEALRNLKPLHDGNPKGAHLAAVIRRRDDWMLFEGVRTKQDAWMAIDPHGPPTSIPLPRQKHTATFLRGHLYVIGGTYGGRALSDIQVMDLCSPEWVKLVPKHGVVPAVWGHTTLVWNGQLLIVGGVVENAGLAPASPTMEVFELNTATGSVEVMHTHGMPPMHMHSAGAAIVDDKLYVWGGAEWGDNPTAKDAQPTRTLGDLHVLDLFTKEWFQPSTHGPAPEARYGHALMSHNGSLVMYGGARLNGACLNDLHILTLHNLTWTKCPCAGDVPPPVQRMSMAPIKEGVWALTGGAYEEKGKFNRELWLLVATIAKGLVWRKVVWTAMKPPMGGEAGALVCAANKDDSLPSYLVAYGGYDNRYLKEAAVLEIGPLLESCILGEQGDKKEVSSGGSPSSVLGEGESPESGKLPRGLGAQVLNDYRARADKLENQLAQAQSQLVQQAQTQESRLAQAQAVLAEKLDGKRDEAQREAALWKEQAEAATARAEELQAKWEENDVDGLLAKISDMEYHKQMLMESIGEDHAATLERFKPFLKSQELIRQRLEVQTAEEMVEKVDGLYARIAEAEAEAEKVKLDTEAFKKSLEVELAVGKSMQDKLIESEARKKEVEEKLLASQDYCELARRMQGDMDACRAAESDHLARIAELEAEVAAAKQHQEETDGILAEYKLLNGGLQAQLTAADRKLQEMEIKAADESEKNLQQLADALIQVKELKTELASRGIQAQELETARARIAFLEATN